MKKKAVLFLNIGSPATTEVKDVKKYLNRFLMDPYVINLPSFLRWIFVTKLIVPRRAPRSAEAYKKVWTKDGSPLVSITKRLMDNLNLIDTEHEWFSAMRYSEPEVLDVLAEIKNKGYDSLIVFPAYPQYAASSTESIVQYVNEKLKIMGWQPNLYQIKDFYLDPEFIENIVLEIPKNINPQDFDHVLFSFHGLPESHLKKISSKCQFSACCDQITDENKMCYRAQCYQTAKAVAEKLSLNIDKWSMSFQSRLGPVKWIEPYTDVVAVEKAKIKQSLLVFSLAFVTDCLETLEELDIGLKEDFFEHGGQKFERVPCLNEKFYSAIAVAKRAIKVLS